RPPRRSALLRRPPGIAPASGVHPPLLALQRMLLTLPRAPAALATHLAHFVVRQRAAAVLSPGAAGGIGHRPAVVMAAVMPDRRRSLRPWLVGRQPGRGTADSTKAEAGPGGRAGGGQIGRAHV